ncbi:heavy-metal-associated domain-containing protein [Azospirillum doebereinerae]|uniref:heavy-metal-associated domain-containing protein n=1 Tax=Azospirillum doebereinerae TaxID=92933 RepID=UPI00384FF7D2
MQTVKVDGMTCGHCAQTVTKALEALPAVERALVDLKTGEVVVEGERRAGGDPQGHRGRRIRGAGRRLTGEVGRAAPRVPGRYLVRISLFARVTRRR